MRRSGSSDFSDAETNRDDVASLDGGVGAEATGAIEIRDGIGRTRRALGHELLLVDEPHHAQVLAGERRRAFGGIDNGGLDQLAEIEKSRVTRRCAERDEELRDARPDGGGYVRSCPLAGAQESLPFLLAESLDQRLRAQRRLDGRQGSEARRLE